MSVETTAYARPGEGEAVNGAALPLVVEHVAKGYDFNGQDVPVIADLRLTMRKEEIVTNIDHYDCGKKQMLKKL